MGTGGGRGFAMSVPSLPPSAYRHNTSRARRKINANEANNMARPSTHTGLMVTAEAMVAEAPKKESGPFFWAKLGIGDRLRRSLALALQTESRQHAGSGAGVGAGAGVAADSLAEASLSSSAANSDSRARTLALGIRVGVNSSRSLKRNTRWRVNR